MYHPKYAGQNQTCLTQQTGDPWRPGKCLLVFHFFEPWMSWVYDDHAGCLWIMDASHDVELDAVKPVLPTASENAQHINILPFISVLSFLVRVKGVNRLPGWLPPQISREESCHLKMLWSEPNSPDSDNHAAEQALAHRCSQYRNLAVENRMAHRSDKL